MTTALFVPRLHLVYPQNNDAILYRSAMVCAVAINQNLYFRVGDTNDRASGWQSGSPYTLRLRILYLDTGTENIDITYSQDGTTETTETIVAKTNTAEWKWTYIDLTADPIFAHTLYQEFNNADFYLSCTGELNLAGAVLIDKTGKAEASWFAQPLMAFPNLSSQVIGGNGNTNTTAASGTDYLGLFGSYHTNLNRARTVIPFAGTLSNLYVRTLTAQPAGGSLVYTLYVNGVGSVLTVTVGAGAAAGVVSDTTHTVALAAGDDVALQAVNNAGAAVSAAHGAWSLQFDVDLRW